MKSTTSAEPLSFSQPNLLASPKFKFLTSKSLTKVLLTLTLLSPLVDTNAALPRAGLIMHLDASLGIESSNKNISQWWDQSGNGQNLTATGNPRLVQHSLNGRPAVVLDSPTEQLSQTGTSSLPRFDNDRTLIVLSASDSINAALGYGRSKCGASFGLARDSEGYSALDTGCENSLMFAQGQSYEGEWNLHVLTLRAGTFTHLRDGALVDARTSRFNTLAGPFQIGMRPSSSGSASGGSLKVATVLAYNWALGAEELIAVQHYIGTRWFNNANRFRTPPNLAKIEIPQPAMQLSLNSHAGSQLELVWRASFADECRAVNGWTQASGTSGRVTIANPQPDASYALNCWNRTNGITGDFNAIALVAANAQPVEIFWQAPTGQEHELTGYRLFVGEQSQNYSQVVQLPANSANSHTLQLAPGDYFLAMSTVGQRGLQSSLSREIAIRID